MTSGQPRAVGPDGSKAGRVGDRSWLRHVEPIPEALVEAWLTEADERQCEVLRGLDPRPPLAPGISVIIPSHRGRAHIARCLRSLAAQTLDPGLFEVIVVLNGEPDGTSDVIKEFRQEYPSVELRMIRLSLAGAARARNAGIAAASREYTTFVDDDDYVSPAFLEVLLAYARPDVVPVASLVDVGPDGENPDNRINRMLREHTGRRTAPADIPVATTFNAAKAVATDLIKNISYDVSLASGEDVVFWTNVVVRWRVSFYPCPPSDGAAYYRVLRQHSVSRPVPTFDFAVNQRLAVISRLDQLAEESDGRTASLVHDRIGAQTDFINAYLRQRPGEHGRVVEAVDRCPATRVPFDRMYRGLPRALAIAYAFPPYADTSAVVMAKRIRARGEIVDVVYNAMDRIRETDESLRRISGPFVADEAVVRTPSYFADWGSMERFAVEGLKVIQQWEVAKGRYERVYSRAQFAASHILAAAYKLSNPAATWTAEFSDPLSRDIHDQERGTPVTRSGFVRQLRRGMSRLGLSVPRSRNCFVWCEELAYALADELIFTNENQMEYMLGYCSNPDLAAVARKKAVIAPHPTLPPEFYSLIDCAYPLDAQMVHLGYFGNFYATRGLDDVLAAIAGLDSATRGRLRLHVFTAKPEAVERRAAELGISEAVRVAPYLRYLEFLNLTTKLDCLIVNDAATTGSHRHNPYLPSKWSDYRGSGTPVWGLVEPGSALSREVLDFVSPVGDVAAAVDVLSLIVNKRLGC